MPVEDDLFEKLRLELRRGSLIVAVLAALRDERYGYTLRKVQTGVGQDLAQGVTVAFVP